MVIQSVHPATTLETATSALEYEKPLQSGDGRYVDLSTARGDDARVQIRKQLERKQPGRPLHLAFVSHRGAGKSTELFRLAHELSPKFHTLHLEANVEMDPIKFEMEDLLVVLCRSVAKELERIGHGLSGEALKDVESFFAETIRHTEIGRAYLADIKSEAKAGADAGFLSLTSKITALLRVEGKERTEVKEAFRRYPSALMKSANRLLEEAHRVLKQSLQKELLIVIDNLDRYDPSVAEALLIRQGDRFRSLKTNLLVTPPIAVIYRPSTVSLEEFFHTEIMCSVRLRNRFDAYDACAGPGRGCLVAALGRRIDLDKLLPDESARDRLLVGSGGSIRDLLELTYSASLRADGVHMTLDDVENAVRSRRSRMKDTVDNNEGWAEALVHIGRHKELGPSESFLRVLFQRLAFKYNGEYWYDIHPLVYEMPRIRQALDDA